MRRANPPEQEKQAQLAGWVRDAQEEQLQMGPWVLMQAAHPHPLGCAF